MTKRRRLEQELSKLRRRLATGGPARGPKPRTSAASGTWRRGRARSGQGSARHRRHHAARLGSGVAAVVSVVDGKAGLVVSVSNDLKMRSVPSTWYASALRAGGEAGAAAPISPRARRRSGRAPMPRSPRSNAASRFPCRPRPGGRWQEADSTDRRGSRDRMCQLPTGQVVEFSGVDRRPRTHTMRSRPKHAMTSRSQRACAAKYWRS